MQMNRLFWLVAAGLVSACSGNEVRSTLGLNQRAPDEFVVYARPPLSVPPEFDLQPPQPGAENPNAPNPEADARKTLLGTVKKPATLEEAAANVPSNVDTAVEPVLTSDAPTGPQSSFLSKLGTDKADPTIREQLQKDAAPDAPAKKKKKKAQSMLESIVGDDEAEPVVDAKKEAERIRANRDAGKPVTEGETPVEDTKSKSVIDQLF